MKTKVLTNAKLISYERRNNSTSGNPSWYIRLDNGAVRIIGKTASNARCGYKLANFIDGRLANVTYHITNAGNTIIDDISEVK